MGATFTSQLLDLIKQKGQVSQDEVYYFAFEKGHKPDTCSRLLRKSKLVEPIKNDKGHITGYKWIQQVNHFTPEYYRNIEMAKQTRLI